MVATDGSGVVLGVVQVQGDGEIQAHVSLLVVLSAARNRGIARSLMHAALLGSNCLRTLKS
jgi:ribosomal protein S18 acetylase RimI-like enzyme